MKEQKRLIRWIKEHRKELIIAGVSIAGIIGTILLIKNRAALKAYWKLLIKAVGKSGESRAKTAETVVKATEEVVKTAEKAAKTSRAAEVIPFDVARHVRNLPNGWHASMEKLATALEHGIELGEGQTWVEAYRKGVVA